MKWRQARLQFKRPSAATTIAVLALVLSALQFGFSVPLLTQFYIRPDLVVTGSSSKPQDKILFATYTVSNEGNAAATKIEVGFIIEPHQRVTVVPRINANIVEEQNPVFIKNVRIEVERLSPREKFSVRIFPGPSLETLKSDVADVLSKVGMKVFPAFSFARSAEGPGRYVPAEGDKAFRPSTRK